MAGDGWPTHLTDRGPTTGSSAVGLKGGVASNPSKRSPRRKEPNPAPSPQEPGSMSNPPAQETEMTKDRNPGGG